MKKHAFVLIRYSILTKNNSAWVIGRDNDFEEYKKSLFSKERMSLHEELFFNVTVPSLEQMDPELFTILLFTSKELPAENMVRLEDLQKKLVNLEVIPLSVEGRVVGKMHSYLQEELERFDQDVCYATIRLDDDDALSDSFPDSIAEYIRPEFKGHAISFSKGYEALYEEGGYSFFSERLSPKISMGLSYIDTYSKGVGERAKSVYGLGNHVEVDEKHPLIINPLEPMYIRTVHSGSDVFSKSFSNRRDSIRGVGEVDIEEVADKFVSIRRDGKKIIVRYPATNLLGEGCALYCVTHHSTVLFYSSQNTTFSHKKVSDIDATSGEKAVLVDAKDNGLILEGSGERLLYNGSELSCKEGEGLPVSIDKRGRGFCCYAGTDSDVVYLSAERGGSLSFKDKCREWEIFYKN